MVPVRTGITAGVQVRYGDSVWTVAKVLGDTLVLADVTGDQARVPRRMLLSDPGFALLPAGTRPPLPARGALEQLPDQVEQSARWWQDQVVEVLDGIPPGARAGTAPRPGYDPARFTLRQRELTKVVELAEAGVSVSLRGFQRRRRSYQREGLLGLVDGRRRKQPGQRVDPRVIQATRTAIAEEADRSTGTVDRLRRRVEHLLAEQEVDPSQVMPSRATFFRLTAHLTAGRHTFGSAPTRRSLAQRPAGPFGTVTALRPGEWVMTDSTPLDVRVVLDDGTTDRVELCWMLDLATRSIPAAVLRPSIKAVDASLLLARCLTPEPMRPGWTDALRLSASVLPYARMVDLDTRLSDAAARPVIVPETIVCDHGSVYTSAAFRAACRSLGISWQPTHAGCPWEKGEVERSFNSMASLFAQYVAGYTGRNVDRRGSNPDDQAAWPITGLQALLDEWVVACWQNRPHDGLRHPVTPGAALSPNQMYAALVQVAGYAPVPLGPGDYIELLPVTWRVINSYGIQVGRRRYDAPGLNPYRRQHSGVAGKNGRWEIHYDPYDVTRVWVRNHHDGGWITADWTHLSSPPVPFGQQAWQQAQRILARRGQDHATEAQIADAVTELLDTAGAGPTGGPARSHTRRDRRVAARTRATTTPAWPRPDTDHPGHDDPGAASPAAATELNRQPDDDGDVIDGQVPAAVTPLGIFDAAAEARTWW